jgi:hypothetical protein
MFERPHHRRIALVLLALDGRLLRQHHCLFGGGTAIALRYGEYRESVDMDFLISAVDGYRRMRTLLVGAGGIAAILRKDAPPLPQIRELKADQYGLRTMLKIGDQQIKFEIILEGRIQLDSPGPDDETCGIATLTPLDLAAEKLLANSDRWADEGVFNRDLIDLAMMRPSRTLLRAAITKAKQAYGEAIVRDVHDAAIKLLSRKGWMDRCMTALAIRVPKALLYERVRVLERYTQ